MSKRIDYIRVDLVVSINSNDDIDKILEELRGMLESVKNSEIGFTYPTHPYKHRVNYPTDE